MNEILFIPIIVLLLAAACCICFACGFLSGVKSETPKNEPRQSELSDEEAQRRERENRDARRRQRELINFWSYNGDDQDKPDGY